jgi:hypothetical protein
MDRPLGPKGIRKGWSQPCSCHNERPPDALMKPSCQEPAASPAQPRASCARRHGLELTLSSGLGRRVKDAPSGRWDGVLSRPVAAVSALSSRHSHDATECSGGVPVRRKSGGIDLHPHRAWARRSTSSPGDRFTRAASAPRRGPGLPPSTSSGTGRGPGSATRTLTAGHGGEPLRRTCRESPGWCWPPATLDNRERHAPGGRWQSTPQGPGGEAHPGAPWPSRRSRPRRP